MLWATLILINGAGFVGSMPPAGSPENITIMFLSPSSVKVSWTTSIEHVDKYDVTYKPTDASYRVVAVVAGNSDSVTLSGLLADTQYQITVSAVRDGKKYKSRPIVFRTLEPPRTNEVQLTPPGARSGGQRGVPPFTNMPPTYIQVRGVEVAIVVLVLMVWVAAIILFFNRWGKIRMLLPYQPDYKDTQLKVPGTGACSGANACQSTQGNTCCSQRYLHQCGLEEIPGWRTRLSRSRINSAVYIPNSASECDPLVPRDCSVSLRRAKSAGNLQGQHHDLEFQRPDSEFQRQDPEFQRQDSDVFIQESDTSGQNHFELPILSISVATEKPFVEQHL